MDFIVEPMEQDPGGSGCGVNCNGKVDVCGCRSDYCDCRGTNICIHL